MRRTILFPVAMAVAIGLAGCGPAVEQTADGAAAKPAPTLASWRDGAARDAIIAFVARVTDPASPDFVPAPERVAVFDNDGTLWAEKPAYFQLMFIIDRVKALAPEHPEWATTQPFQAVLDGDMEALKAGGVHGLMELAMATHAGMDSDAFAAVATAWLATARHPVRDVPYTELTYVPMRELLDYLRAHGFRTFIVSGGGVAFMRPFTAEAYGIPPEQVVGSSIETAFEMVDGVPRVVRKPEIHFIDDKEGKPVGIERFIGRRPIAAFGNSDGDLQMLQWTTAGEGARLGVIIHHTDAEREWAYDRDTSVGHLEKALDMAPAAGWVVVDMARDWARVFRGDAP